MNRVFINEPVTTLFEKPNIYSPVVSQALYATPIIVESSQGEWCYIQTPDAYHGYIQCKAIIERSEDYLLEPHQGKVHTLMAHLYDKPDITLQFPSLSLLYGTAVLIVEQQSRFVRIKLLNNQDYWAAKNDFKIDAPFLTLDEAIDESFKLMHQPYFWGGTSTKNGYDCSGLIQTIAKWMGITIPRDAYLQAAALCVEDLNAVQKGNLFFFGHKKIDHVGLCINEGGDFLHSHSNPVKGAPGVRIDNIHEEKWAKSVNCIRSFSNS